MNFWPQRREERGDSKKREKKETVSCFFFLSFPLFQFILAISLRVLGPNLLGMFFCHAIGVQNWQNAVLEQKQVGASLNIEPLANVV